MTDRYHNETTQPVSSRWRSNPARHIVAETQSNRVQRLVAEIDRDIALLDQSIVAEEASTRVFDVAEINYSLAARHMQARRTNLASTKVALLARLAHH
jgi:hypothetical protein